jgi:hypothetical protein
MGTKSGKGGRALWVLGVASLIPAAAAGGPPVAPAAGEPPAAMTPAATTGGPPSTGATGEPPAATAPTGTTDSPPAAATAQGAPPAAAQTGPTGHARYYSPWAYRTPILFRLSQCIHTWRASPPSGYPTGPWSYLIIKDPVYIFDPKQVPSVPGAPAPGTTAEAGERAPGEARPADTTLPSEAVPLYVPER